jgi:hypothetical protein
VERQGEAGVRLTQDFDEKSIGKDNPNPMTGVDTRKKAGELPGDFANLADNCLEPVQSSRESEPAQAGGINSDLPGIAATTLQYGLNRNKEEAGRSSEAISQVVAARVK